MFLKPDYDQNLFKGTADFYAKYRTPYLEIMLENLVKDTNIRKEDKLLDLACGPGRLSIPLAKYFNEVVAIDLEEEMIFEGKRIANKIGINNIQWIIGKAEDLNANSETFKLVTIGDAFHRLDQLVVLKNIDKALQKNGYLAIIGGKIITVGNREWQNVLNRILLKWKKQDNNNINVNYKDQFPKALEEFGFKDVSTKIFEDKITLTVEEIIGYLYSISVYSKQVIGNDIDEFEKTIKIGLLELEPQNIFEHDFSCVYTIGRKE